MLKNGLVAAALVLSTLTVLGQQSTPRFTTSSKLVVVPAVVVDDQGLVVTDLTAGDFQVFEDGKPVPIEAFVPADPMGTPTDGGRFIVLVLDNISLRPELAQRTREIAKRFTSRMTPADSIAAIPARGGGWSGPTTRAAAENAIDRFKPAFGDTIRSTGEDAVDGIRAIAAIAEQLAAVPHRRKVMVVIGNGQLFSPSEPSAFADRGPSLSRDWFDAIRSTARNNFSTYVIDPRGHNPEVGLERGGGASMQPDYAESFAGETGGEAWVNTNNYDAAVGRIWLESANYYLLGYPPAKDDRKLHKIDVKVTRPGVTVRARRSRG